MPNTAVFFPAMMNSPWKYFWILAFRFDRQFTSDFAVASDLRGLCFDCPLLFFRTDWPFQRDLAVLGDYLHVVGIRGEILVGLDCLPNLLRDVLIGTIVLLLIRSGFVWISVTLIHFGVIGRGRVLSRGILSYYHRPAAQHEQTHP